MFDADDVLNRLMVGNRPDAERFEDTINPIVDKAAGSRNELIAGRKCSLLCGYSSSVCPDEGFNAICDRHSHVVPAHTAE